MLEIEPIATPADWTGPLDNIENDDLTPIGTEISSEDWKSPYDEEREKNSAGPHIPEQ